VLRLVLLGPAEQEHHVGIVGRGSPDLLAVDHEVVAIQVGPGAGRGQVAAGARLRIALAPDGLAANGRLNPLLFLVLAADFEQCRHQHADALVHDAGMESRLVELVGDNRRLDHIRFGAVAAVLFGDRTGEIAPLQQERLPVQRLPVGALAAAPGLGRQVPFLGCELAHFLLECFVAVGVFQIHFARP